MTRFNLKESRELQIENDGRQVRVVVVDNGEEWVCRKESFRNLEDFLGQPESYIFKGRLQLFKHAGKISVEVKGEAVGVVDAKKMGKALQQLKNIQ